MKLDLGKVWDEAMTLASANKELLLILAGLFFFLPNLALAMAMPDLANSNVPPAQTPEQMMDQFEQLFGPFIEDFWWIIPIIILTQYVGNLSVLALLRGDSKPTVAEAISSGVKGLVPLLLATILVWLALGAIFAVLAGLGGATGNPAVVAIAIIIALVVTIYVSMKTILVTPVVAIEKLSNPIEIIRRSWQLSKGNSLRIFAFYALILVAYFVVTIIAGLVAALLTSLIGGEVGSLIEVVLTNIIGAVVAAILVCVLAAMYRQLSGGIEQGLKSTFS